MPELAPRCEQASSPLGAIDSHRARGPGNVLGYREERSADRRGPRGQALVEFALVAPILVLIFAGLVQLGLIYERQIGIENAIRDAARRGATFETLNVTEANTNGPFIVNLLIGSGGSLSQNVEGYAGTSISGLTVCYRTQLDAANANSVMVKVQMGYKHPLFLPIIAQILDGFDGANDGALKITTSAEFQVQNASAASVDQCYS
jgi:Flp pilus assembly protein TadG